MSISVTVKSNRIPEIEAKFPGLLDKVIRKTAHDLEAKAKSEVAVDTGNLKASIAAKRVNDNLWKVATGVDYAIYQEMGTVNQEGKAFMVPAAEAVRPAFNKAIAQMLKRL